MQNKLREALYLPEKAAERLNVAKRTIDWWRHVGRGPVYVKVGRRVFYRESDLDDFIASGIIEPVSTKHAKPRSGKAA